MIKGEYLNIDKINCIVNKKINEEQKIYNTKSVPKVIYKPIFYRTYDLQNLQIKSGLAQNIGINLSEYMSKIDAFKLSIDGNNFTEIARNEVYVIFRIDSTILNSTSGEYHILDQDNEYISSGSWNITTIS